MTTSKDNVEYNGERQLETDKLDIDTLDRPKTDKLDRQTSKDNVERQRRTSEDNVERPKTTSNVQRQR
jgi:hypothetical protein